MPGKVNPVMAEMANMVCFQVMGNDLTIALAAEAGQIDLNVMMPVISFNLLQSLEIMRNMAESVTTKLVNGITANEGRCHELVEQSSALATALTPYIGYAAAAEIAKEAVRVGKTVRQIALERQLFPAEDLERILSPLKLTEPGIPGQSDRGNPCRSTLLLPRRLAQF
jgi:aspartate ammonia-lyase